MLSKNRKLLLLSSLAAGAYLLTRKEVPAVVKTAAKAVGVQVDKNLPRGLRNNNPLNLRKGVKWAGLAGDDGAFDIFVSMQAGMNAGAKNMKTQIRKGHNTVAKLINRWAPASDGNNVQAYVNSVCKAAGVQPGYLIDVENRMTFAKILRAMAVHENGAQHAAKLPPLNDWLAATRA